MTDHVARLRDLGAAYARAREDAETARVALRAALVAAVRDGMPETHAAEYAGVNRMTVRAAVGKRPGRNGTPIA